MSKKYSYVTLLTNDDYVYGVALLVESMKRVETKYPLHVLITDGVSLATQEILKQLGVSFQLVETISIPDKLHERNMKIAPGTATVWHDCWTKFHIFNLIQFDKIIFLDADLLILKNLDHLFDKPHMTAALDGEYFGLWEGWPHFNSGCMVIEPSQELFEDIQTFGKNLTNEQLANDPFLYNYVVADQELLNLYYKDWPQQKELHLNQYYNVFAPYTQDEQIDDLEQNCYFIHYVGRKPWRFWVHNPNEHYSEFYYTKGHDYVQSICSTINLSKAREKLILSVYGICKNERHNIEQYLDSFGEADYVCLLDTGSTDGTWEYLQEKQKTMKNLIIKQEEVRPWRYDKARNISMTIIPKETTMFFMADLDEVIKEKGWSKEVKGKWEPGFDRGMYDYNRDVGENDTVLRSIKEYRIHSKYWDHWENIVHEALVNKMGIKQFYIETSTPMNITVWHYPQEDKKTNYAELCEADLKEFPDDYVMRLQLAIEYEILGNWGMALNHYMWLIENPNTLQGFEKARCYSGVGKAFCNLNQVELALRYFSEGRLLFPHFADNYLDAAQVYYDLKQWDKVIELCNRALKNCPESFWCSVHDTNSYYVYWMCGLSYSYINNYEKAIVYTSIAKAINPIDDILNTLDDMIVRQRAILKQG